MTALHRAGVVQDDSITVADGTNYRRTVSNEGSTRTPSLYPPTRHVPRLSPTVWRLSLSMALPLALSSIRAQQPTQQRPDTITGHRAVHTIPVPSAVAAPRVGNIALDGHLDDEAWSKATPITSFTQVDPKEGEPGTQRTEVRFLYDAEALYVGARLY